MDKLEKIEEFCNENKITKEFYSEIVSFDYKVNYGYCSICNKEMQHKDYMEISAHDQSVVCSDHRKYSKGMPSVLKKIHYRYKNNSLTDNDKMIIESFKKDNHDIIKKLEQEFGD